MSKRRVLAISNDLDQLRRIVASLERAGAEVDAVRSPEAIAAEVIPHRYIFFSAADGDVRSLQGLVPKLRERSHVTIVTPKASLSDLTVYLRDDRVNHVVVGDELDHGVFVTAQKLLIRATAYDALFGHYYQPDVFFDYEPHLEYLPNPYEGFRAYLSAMYQY